MTNVVDAFLQRNTISLSLDCSSEEEIKTFYSNLACGRHITYPLYVEFWCGTFGTLTDKFGRNWLFNYEKKPKE
ncbi:MAG: hypothetical protein NVS4B12_16610 [Ktedonobacteraceae bacterium]